MDSNPAVRRPRRILVEWLLDGIEWAGNKLPDPAFLFVIALFLTWACSAWLAPIEFTEVDPRSKEPIRVVDQLTAESLVLFIANMVKNFVEFPPLGLVLVALLGVGVAERVGFIHAMLKGLLQLTPQHLLTPMVLFVSILSHCAGDTGYVVVIPLGGIMFAAAGRHPVLGIVTAFAGVSGGFSANFLPSGLDPLLQGFTQTAARIVDRDAVVNPLCNWGFMAASGVVLVFVGWYLTDRVVEPRVQRMSVDQVASESITMGELTQAERRGLVTGLIVLVVLLLILAGTAFPADSPWRASDGDLAGKDSPLMKAIVPLIFLLFLIPGAVYGYVAGTVRSHRDIVKGMIDSMGSVSYYLVLAFFAAQFTAAFTQSKVGVLLAIKGAGLLASWHLPPQVTIVGLIVVSGLVDLLIGSASAKWALLSPIFVPMLMLLGISPELTQAAYRVGDSSTNIITPFMPYFPLVVVYVQRYVKSAGIGTLISLMLPYSIAFMVASSVLLILFWMLGIPMGPQAPYTYAVGVGT